MSRSPEAYLHTPTAYQTDLSSGSHDAGIHATSSVECILRSSSVGPVDMGAQYLAVLKVHSCADGIQLVMTS